MNHFFEIDIQYINLFSIMIGMSLVVLSNLWGGRIQYTRIVFVYLAALALYYGYVKHNIIDFNDSTKTNYTRKYLK